MDGEVLLKPERKAMSMVRAIYEGGVFRPLTPPELPDGVEVEFELHVVPPNEDASMEAIFEILDARFESGEHDVAERHNETCG
jgi:predicted DNA-binding antitoxin AbrB/MazE fold protein